VGRQTDERCTLLIALGGSSLGYALLASTTNFAFLLITAAVPIAIGAAAFSQSIALVKRHFDHASPHTTSGALESSSPVGRSLGRSDRQSERQSQQRSASISDEATHHNGCKSANGGLTIALAFTALALFHTALFMRSIPLPIVVTSSLNGTERDVGLMFSLCAALEIVVMGVFIWRPLNHGERAAIAAGFAAFVAYFA